MYNKSELNSAFAALLFSDSYKPGSSLDLFLNDHPKALHSEITPSYAPYSLLSELVGMGSFCSVDHLLRKPGADIFFCGQCEGELNRLKTSISINFYLALKNIHYPHEKKSYYERLYWLSDEGVSERMLLKDEEGFRASLYESRIVPWVEAKAISLLEISSKEDQAFAYLAIALMEKSAKNARSYFIRQAFSCLVESVCIDAAKMTLLAFSQALDNWQTFSKENDALNDADFLAREYEQSLEQARCFFAQLASNVSVMSDDKAPVKKTSGNELKRRRGPGVGVVEEGQNGLGSPPRTSFFSSTPGTSPEGKKPSYEKPSGGKTKKIPSVFPAIPNF